MSAGQSSLGPQSPPAAPAAVRTLRAQQALACLEVVRKACLQVSTRYGLARPDAPDAPVVKAAARAYAEFHAVYSELGDASAPMNKLQALAALEAAGNLAAAVEALDRSAVPSPPATPGPVPAPASSTPAQIQAPAPEPAESGIDPVLLMGDVDMEKEDADMEQEPEMPWGEPFSVRDAIEHPWFENIDLLQ